MEVIFRLHSRSGGIGAALFRRSTFRPRSGAWNRSPELPRVTGHRARPDHDPGFLARLCFIRRGCRRTESVADL